jgi:hypothetical protein
MRNSNSTLRGPLSREEESERGMWRQEGDSGGERTIQVREKIDGYSHSKLERVITIKCLFHFVADGAEQRASWALT